MQACRGFRVRAVLDEHYLHPRGSAIAWTQPFTCCQEAEHLSAIAPWFDLLTISDGQ